MLCTDTPSGVVMRRDEDVGDRLPLVLRELVANLVPSVQVRALEVLERPSRDIIDRRRITEALGHGDEHGWHNRWHTVRVGQDDRRQTKHTGVTLCDGFGALLEPFLHFL